MTRTASGRGVRAAVAVAVVAGTGLAWALVAQAGTATKLASRSSEGTPANGNSFTDVGGSVSGDGRFVAFESSSPNLPGGSSTISEIYVRNMNSGRTRLVSTTNAGQPAAGDVMSSAISANGRFVVFHGYGDGLPGADGTHQQVWIHDRKTGKTSVVSKANDGHPGDGSSSYASVSAGGRFVVFLSNAAALPGGDGTDAFTYIRDRKRGKTILVSRANGGAPIPGDVFGESISANGRRAIFESDDTDLPPHDGREHIYLRDLAGGRTKLVDRTSKGAPANDASYYPSISGDGRWVGFDSDATNLPAGDGSHRQAYVKNVGTGRLVLASRNSRGRPQNVDAYYPHPSGNGHRVVFVSDGMNLLGLHDGSTVEVYVRDLRRGKTRLLSMAGNGDPADDSSDYPTITRDGRFAAFDSLADNLGGNDAYSNAFRAGPIG